MDRSSWMSAASARGEPQLQYMHELHGRYRALHRCELTSRFRASSPVVGTIAPGDRVEAVEARLGSGGRARLRVWTRHRGMSLNGWVDLVSERGKALLQKDWPEGGADDTAVSVVERFHTQHADSVTPRRIAPA